MEEKIVKLESLFEEITNIQDIVEFMWPVERSDGRKPIQGLCIGVAVREVCKR